MRHTATTGATRFPIAGQILPGPRCTRPAALKKAQDRVFGLIRLGYKLNGRAIRKIAEKKQIELGIGNTYNRITALTTE